MTKDQTYLFATHPYNGIDRTDNPAYPIFDKIYKGMQKRFWIPESTPMGSDYQRFKDLPSDVQRIYTLNLQWQIAADTAQTPNILDLLLLANNIEFKSCLKYQLMIEDLHSLSYNYIVASMYDNPTEMLDEIDENEDIYHRMNCVG